GRRGDDGSIRIEGRLDRQMSVNGFRLAPEDVETTALRHPAVALALAGPISAPTGDLIELSVVLAAPGAADVRSLRAFLRSALPSYAVPSRIQIVPTLVLDANHKVTTRSRTPAGDPARPESRPAPASRQPPENRTRGIGHGDQV
ncbi:MAG: hypothetical protein QOI74_3512, partial [Micromonosporaceae bacterium]|nr:hypothetical protein [Micromonosporaceae bacterium]